jgi:tetratricopeptide (TPR) repeat protein
VKAGEWQAALALFTRAIEVQPDYPFAYADRARARAALADMTGALEDLSRAIALDPQYSWNYGDRGRVYMRLSRLEEAAADFSMAIRLDPSQFQFYALRAETLMKTGSLNGAIADWDRVIELEPGYGPAWEPRAALAWAMGDWACARTAFLRAWDFDESEFSYLLCAGLCALREGKDAGAVVQPVLARAPADSWYHDTARYLSDRRFEGAFLARVDKERSAWLKARMLLYAGVTALSNGMHRAGLIYLLQAEGRGAPGAVETGLVGAELARLNALPKS